MMALLSARDLLVRGEMALGERKFLRAIDYFRFALEDGGLTEEEEALARADLREAKERDAERFGREVLPKYKDLMDRLAN